MASTREEDMMRMQRMLGERTGSALTAEELQSDMSMLRGGGAVAPQALQSLDQGARARENIPANMDMGMDSEMPVPMTVVEQVTALMDMGLTEDEALEAIAIERSSGQIQPQDFGGQRQMQQPNQMSGNMQPMQPSVNPGMGALSGVPAGNERPMVMPTPRPAMPPRLGADRTFNPMDQLTPYNAPNT